MLIDTIKKEKMIALKEKDNDKKDILGVIVNKYMVLGYEAKANGKELSDVDLIQIINKTMKELEEEKQGYIKVNRTESVAKIEAQIQYISSYLPKMMSEEEIKNVILSLEDKNVPSVMKHFKQNFAGKCDMGLVNKILKSL